MFITLYESTLYQEPRWLFAQRDPISKCVNTKWLLCWQNEPDLVIRHVVEHLLDLCGVFHMGGDWVRGAEGVHLHGLETFPQEEVILAERKCV